MITILDPPGDAPVATTGLGSLGALAALNTEPEIPPLHSSLAKYFRDDLIVHVKDLPGESLERQVSG